MFVNGSFAPQPDLGPFAEWTKVATGGVPFCRRRCLFCTAENGHAGIVGGEDR
jgi:hypothetical protein